MISQAVESELQDLLIAHAGRRTEDGKAGVIRNGFLPEREIQTGIGPVSVQSPKVRSRTGEPVTFRAALVPAYVRKTKSLEAALPWLYLKRISTGEMHEALQALQVLVGPEARGLSASTVSRLKQVWAEEYRDWYTEGLDKDRWVYVWADGVYSGLRAEHTKLCALVIIGVNERGKKHFLGIEDGIRESTQSWRAIWQAQTKVDAEQAFDLFIDTYEAKYPKATTCLEKDHETLMTFYDFPAVHWQHIRISDPIESTPLVPFVTALNVQRLA